MSARSSNLECFMAKHVLSGALTRVEMPPSTSRQLGPESAHFHGSGASAPTSGSS